MLNKLLCLCGAAIFGFSTAAFAAVTGTTNATFPTPALTDNYKTHMGVLAGLHSPDEGDSGTEYGAEVGYQPYIPFGVAVELSTAKTDIDVGPVEEELTQTKLLLKGTYHLGGTVPIIKHMYGGFAFGPMLESFRDSDELALATAPLLGLDVPLGHRDHKFISLGAHARYVFSSTAAPDAFSLYGALKYWF